MSYTLYFDGACRGNPGRSSYGLVVFDKDGNEVLNDKGCIGITTNNVAEYCGLLRGLIVCEKMGITDLNVKGDSNLVIQHVTGKWKVRNENLKKYIHRLKKSIKNLNRFLMNMFIVNSINEQMR